MNDLIVWTCVVLVVERVTEIIVESELTSPARNWWKKITYPIDHPPPNNPVQWTMVWFDKLVSCGYCSSVWVGGFFAMWLPGTIISEPPCRLISAAIADWFVKAIVLHGLANLYHVVYQLLRRGRIWTFDIEHKVTMTIADKDEDDLSEQVDNGSFGPSIGAGGEQGQG